MEDIAALLWLAVISWSEPIFCHSCQGVRPVPDKRHGLYRSNSSVPHVLYVRNHTYLSTSEAFVL